MKQRDGSWQKVGGWYNKIVGEGGHYYHQKIILPNSLRLLQLKKGERLVDVGCGQGILAKYIPEGVEYLGIDLAKSLVDIAQKQDKNPRHHYLVADVSREIKLGMIDKVVMILSLQNIKKPFGVIKNCHSWLKTGGKILMVLNHPAFRIPKHTDWEEKNGRQWRIVDHYMSPLEIPIESSPFNKRNNQISFSFHYPISFFTEILADNGMVIEIIEEWVSDKKSIGIKAKIEDEARGEIPLFMAILAQKS
jgi:SAM-dependent methyltransferase